MPTPRSEDAATAVNTASAGRVSPEAHDTAWHTVDIAAAAELLESSADGLSSQDAKARLQRYGPNEIEVEREVPWWSLLIHQFRDPLIYILLIAGAATLALRDYTDSGVIFAVVLINAAVGFIQEFRARAAMRALAGLSAPKAEVLRDGNTETIEGRDLVPGDVVLLASGAHVPADLRLLKVTGLEIDESALTGESIAARKTVEALESEDLVAGDQTNVAFAGTTVTRGRGRGLVVRTGAHTQVGRIASAMREVGDVATPLQEKVAHFGRGVGIVSVALALLVAVVGLARGLTLGEISLTAVAIAVSAIPEGLPVVLTVTLAIAVRRMARRRAIIRSLPAVETLGSTTVIGTDKTGTLTTNQMTVRAIWIDGREYEVTGVGFGAGGAVHLNGTEVRASEDAALRRTLLAATLANEAEPAGSDEGEEARGDPTEVALHVAAAKAGMDPGDTRDRFPEVDVLPFEPERRFMATLNEVEGKPVLMLKGAPESLLPRCHRMLAADGSERELDAAAVRDAADELAHRGLRVLALAYADDAGREIDEDRLEQGIVLAGLAGMEDPLRPESVRSVASAHEAGIRVVMITGDHVETAQAIGVQLGLKTEGGAAVGQDIQSMSDAQLDDVVSRIDVFARVAPEHKLRIVERLKAAGEVVAVTGDGVNDAPALRAAHIGVAMGASGTDVAREAADMVLADDNFATITAAVEEGRVVFSNIRKVTFFLLSTAVGEAMAILFALAAGWPLPFVAAQILWINLATNGLQDVALAFEPGEPGILQQRPRKRAGGLLTWRLFERLGGVGVVLAAGTLGVFWWTLRNTNDLDLARTVAMTQMVVFQFFHVFNSRSLDRSIFSVPPFSNKPLFASLIAAAASHDAVGSGAVGHHRPRGNHGDHGWRARQGKEQVPGTATRLTPQQE
jgi:magnesium-transporting ATPase (P-type)